MGATATRMTAEQYYAVSVEGDRKQLVEGQIVVNEPKTIHALLQTRLCAALHQWATAARGRGLALMPTDVRLDDYNVYGPDVIWFAEATLSLAYPDGLDAYPERVPDLCVEIRSPSTWRYDVGAKKRVYERTGLQELWLVDDAADTVLVYRRSAPDTKEFDVALELWTDEVLTSPQLPDFELALAELFAR
jgi:Uma2 family endonuclease